MASPWIGVVTNAGKSLFTAWIDDTKPNFGAAEGGTGTVAEAALLAQTALVNKKQDISLLKGERVEDGIKLLIQITAPATGYTLNQIGIKASIDNGAPVMVVLLQNSVGISIPSRDDTPDFIYKHFALIEVSNTGDFTLTVDTSALVSTGTLEEAIASHNVDADAHAGTFATLENLESVVDEINTQLSDKEPAITGSTAATYWNGLKTFTDFATSVRAAVLTGLSTATNAVVTAADSVLTALGKLQAQITGHKNDTSNPHSVTKAQLELGNVDNTSDASKPVSTATQTALDAKEPSITSGTTSQYWRGDKTWQTLNASAAGAVPTTRTINNKALSADITLAASDVGADKTLVFTGKTVATAAWAADTTYDGFGYRTAVACTGVTAAMVPGVVFSPSDATSGKFAPVADSYAGGVYLYASEIPTATITIPTITATTVGGA